MVFHQAAWPPLVPFTPPPCSILARYWSQAGPAMAQPSCKRRRCMTLLLAPGHPLAAWLLPVIATPPLCCPQVRCWSRADTEAVATATAAEIYDPSTGSWASAGNMTAIRTGHTATVLNSGEVLVAGYGSADLYNPTTGTWKPTPTRMVFDRNGHTATLLPSGTGTRDGWRISGSSNLSTAEVYDPTTGIWTSTGSMASVRAYHTAILLPSGKVLVTGGSQDSGGADKVATVELYDPTTGTWSSTVSMLAARSRHTATLLHSNNVLVAGSSNNPMAEVYEP